MAKIIVIDDESDIRDVVSQVLTREGYEVIVAEDSEAGLDALREHGAELVITDIIMPGKDGVQTVYDIRKEFPNTKVLVISGGGNVPPQEYDPGAIKTSAYLASATAAGADTTLTKPFGRKELIEAVCELLEDVG